MDYKNHKVQCEIKVVYEHYDKVFDCIQQLTVKELEDILNDKDILIKCIDGKFINKIIKKLTDICYENYSEYINYYGIIKIYFDKYIITIFNVIPININKLFIGTPGVWMRGKNIIIAENEFVKDSEFIIDRVVNIEEIHVGGYMHSRPDGVKYNIKINTKEEGY